jgi:hypothetical protein
MMSMTVQRAHQQISAMMIERRLSELPISLCYINHKTNRLVIGLADATPETARHYHRRLRAVIGNVPVTLLACRAVRHANKQDYTRPLIGGILINCPDVGASGVGTICLVASRGGQQGFVTCGHVVVNADAEVYQPRQSTVNDWLVGTATVVSNYTGTANSDSAFVTAVDTVALSPLTIWKGSSALYTVTGLRVPGLGQAVSMQGASNKTTERFGVIAGANVTVNFADGGVLQGQLLANYLSSDGDSGAPVYVKTNDTEVELVGLNVGGTEPQYTNPQPNQGTYPPASNGTYAIISPWASIEHDLGLDPLNG